MNRWAITQQEWKAARGKWLLNSSKLANAIYNAITGIQIITEKVEIGVEYPARTETAEWIVSFRKEKYQYTEYKASFDLGPNPWENPLVVASSYRAFHPSRYPNYADHMQFNEVQGVLGEMLFCYLFHYPKEDFWNDFCKMSEKKYYGDFTGDGGRDFKLISPKENEYVVNVKTIGPPPRSQGGINMGNLHDDGTPKVRNAIIAPIHAKWEGNILSLTFREMVDAEKFWKSGSDYYDLRLRYGDDNSRYCWPSKFSQDASRTKFNDTFIDFNPRYSDLLKLLEEGPVLPLAPRDIEPNDASRKVLLDNKEHRYGDLFDEHYADDMRWL